MNMFTEGHEYVYSRPRICSQQVTNMFTAGHEYVYNKLRMFTTGHEYVYNKLRMFTTGHEYVYSLCVCVCTAGYGHVIKHKCYEQKQLPSHTNAETWLSSP